MSTSRGRRPLLCGDDGGGSEEPPKCKRGEMEERLQAAERPTHDEFSRTQMYTESETIGEPQYVTVARGEDGTEVYLDENGEEVQMVDEMQDDSRTIEFNFIDGKNVCCGLCEEIVPYDQLRTSHLPQHHPEVMGEEGQWLKDELYMDKKSTEGGFRYDSSMGGEDLLPMGMRRSRAVRNVSQIRMNPMDLDLEQLKHVLNERMMEKMGREVPVSLVDRQHAKCGICNAVVSLNRKFEVLHLVRHFNAWHPSVHHCSGHWRQNRPAQPEGGGGKPLSLQDFLVIDVNMGSLQCSWCGMLMDSSALALHFTEVHPEEIEVPRCRLCLQEMIINARLLKKYGEDYDVSLPDEHHFKTPKFPQPTFRSEAALDETVAKRVQKINNETAPAEEDEDDGEEGEKQGTVTNNSRMTFGRRNKPKRCFVQPSLRQAIPVNSTYVESVTEGQWRCKLCRGNILGAVISAGAIKHYKRYHPEEMDNLQDELCKARLERVSGGCMQFVHAQLVECLLCNLTYKLHKPYNMSRGIRHLRLKHPDKMPENAGETASAQKSPDDVRLGEIIEDEEAIARFRTEHHVVDFDRVQTVYTSGDKDAAYVYVLLKANEALDLHTASQMVQALREGHSDFTVERVVIGQGASKTATDYAKDVVGEEVYEEYYNADEFIDAEFMAEEFIEGVDQHPQQ